VNTIKPILGKRPLSSFLSFVVATSLLVAATAGAGDYSRKINKRSDAPDTILYNGKITTVDAKDSTVEALAIRDGKIIATGKNDRSLRWRRATPS
jgi:hypothetical protein